MGKLTKIVENWVDGTELSALATMADIVFVVIIIIVLIWVGVDVVQAEMQEACYQCGELFTPSLDTPLRTLHWDHPFCSDGCKSDYRLTRI